MERYVFQLSDEWLELDALEMDGVLHHVLRDLSTDGKLLLCLPDSATKAPQENEQKQAVATIQPLLCMVDQTANMLVGEGLGAAVSRQDKPSTSSHRPWVIERAENLQVDAVQPPLPVFNIYPIELLVNGDKANADHQLSQSLTNMPTTSCTLQIEQAEPILNSLAAFPSVTTRDVDLHRQAVRLSLRSGFDELLSVKMLREITPFPHQVKSVERVLRRMRGRALLCDEVGLGKTIEAGIILTEYMLRGLVKRALILTPPSLVEQWKEEVTRKLGLAFVCYDEPRFRATDMPWQTFEYIIASLDTAKREPHREQVLATEFDLVIVDEAHHLKNKSTLAWKFVNQLKKKYILLLTATPIENDMSELFNLITLLKPGQLLTEAEYKRRYVDKKDPLQPKNTDELKKLVQNVMIRNRRSTTGVIHSLRTADTIIIPPQPDEQRFYAELSNFAKSQLLSLTNNKIHPFVLKNLLRQAGSSIACTLPTLRKIAMTDGGLLGHHPGAIATLLATGERTTASAKLVTLLKLCETTPDQTVVFTGFVETQHAITEFLRGAGIDVVSFHGGLSRAQKEQAITEFRERAQVLVSTESGGEGRNLQFCYRMVNFDIPWNPMRIEQRIGRIHRIGQEHEVNIYNLASAGTMEEHILSILDAKVNLFQLVVGELDMILGSLNENREFEDILMDIWMRAKDEAELVRSVDKLGDELLAAKTHYQKVRDVDDRLLSQLVENE